MQAIMCQSHVRQFRQRTGNPGVGQFLSDPRVIPLPPFDPCAVAACARAADGACGFCNTHYQRWRVATRIDHDLDAGQWRQAEPAVAEDGQVSLHGLAPLVVVQVLFGIWQRTRGGAKITDTDLRVACRELVRQQVTSIEECDSGRVRGKPIRKLLNALKCHVRRALADPASEQAKDTWDLPVFGHPGRLTFTGITQQWLRQGAKRWACEDLPRHRVIGATDIPAGPVRGEPSRDLPPEIMTVLCANLDTLQPPEVKAAAQIAIDTGRRPEDILGLPLGCLARDKDGAAVLVYDNAKAHRLGRRLPISQATATVITGQQARVRARFPGTPPAELKLLPAARRNPDGRKPMTIDMLEGRHRKWADQLGPLRTRDGTEFDTAKIVPYAYRHIVSA